MARRLPAVLMLLAVLTFAGPGAAQQPQPMSAPSDAITLGQSAIPLYGPWKFTVGDSPFDPRMEQPLWAEPDFDDSKWETVDLSPKEGAADPVSGMRDYVPGWTTRGHPGYSGYAWYRIRLHVEARPGEKLAIAGPADMDDAYQAFVNGKLAGQFGDFGASHPKVFYSQPVMFPLPQIVFQPTSQPSGSMAIGQQAGSYVLAFRVWMEPGTPLLQPDAGGFHTAPILGEAEAVRAANTVRWVELVRSYSVSAFEAFLFGLLGLMAFSLLLFDRSDHVYAWMGALFLLTAVNDARVAVDSWSQAISIPAANLLSDGLLVPLTYAAWTIVWWVWFGRQGRWVPRAVTALTLLLMVSNILGEEVFFGLISHRLAVRFFSAGVPIGFLFFAVMAWVVAQGIHRQGLEGWLVLPVVILRGIGPLMIYLAALHVNMHYHVFGVTVSLVQVASLLIAVVIAILLLRRLRQSVKRQRQIALDVKQAQEVQQVILPEARTVLPGLVVESDYRPAREVGGDFFQILPNEKDGSLLIVAGDVTGKGLKAGMLVALLVGAIRTATDTNSDPEFVLRTLNKRLIGRSDAQATCLALRIDADGNATLANAGHLPPYLNGEPVEMEGALPLGMLEGAEFSVMRFKLSERDRLILMSDGIAEATDTDGKLFGFERIHELLRTAVNPAEVASAAQQFGQEDDISVISVTRTQVQTPAAV